MWTDLPTLLGRFKFCNIHQTRHVIVRYAMEMVHPIQMYLSYLLLILKMIVFGFMFSEQLTSSFTFLILLLFLFCKTWFSVAFDIIAVLNLFLTLLNLSQSQLNFSRSLEQYPLPKSPIITSPAGEITPFTSISILLTITTQTSSPLSKTSPSPLSKHSHKHLYYHLY